MKAKALQQKRPMRAALLFLLLTTGMMKSLAQPQGALNGLFSVSDTKQVYFSQGNLQYRASTETWRFAINQYDYVGEDNSNISPPYGISVYNGWIDLFGWGTSGYMHGAVCYQPWSTSTTGSDYYAYGNFQSNLYDQYGKADWGYNAISNGGNVVNSWRTLTQEEWTYLFSGRANANQKFGHGKIVSIVGLIVLPDEWTIPSSLSFVSGNGSYSRNVYTLEEWEAMEAAGAIFFPAACYRNEFEFVVESSFKGYYWASNIVASPMYPFGTSYQSAYLTFGSGSLGGSLNHYSTSNRGNGYSVRLVHDYHSFTVTTSANPAMGGTVSGGGIYSEGATCTLAATPAPGFVFVNWTKDGTVVSNDATYQFTVTEAAEYVANFKNIHTQNFNNGWNWWSTYIELNDNDGLSQLENSMGSAGILIKSRANGYVEAYQYNGATNWYGTLESISNEQMYKIRTNATCNATVIGMATTPSDHPINITNGWNWIGFPCNQNVNVEVAMSGFTPENNDVIKGRNGFTTYYSDGNNTMWFGTLNVLESGKGYLYQSNSSDSKTLVFQTGRGEATGENVTTEHNNFQPADEDFADNMTITAVLELDGEELRSDEYELAAFVGDECRGSVRLMYVEPVNRYVAFLTVFGEPSETLRFRLTNGTQTKLSTDEVTFAVDGMIGSLAEPKTLHFGNTQVGENELSKVMVYPNPSKNVFNIQGQGIRRIEVFNVFGQAIVSEETNNDYLQIDLSRYDNGCYMLRVVTDNGITNSQLIKQ